jgi:hypothetical protein
VNPSGQPFGTGTPPAANSGSAQEAVNVPAIMMMVASGLAILFILFGLVMNIAGGGNAAQMDKALSDPNLPPAMKTFLKSMSPGGPMQYIISLVQFGVNGFIIFGALQMRNLKGWGLAMTAAVLSVVPLCFNSCCCLIAMPAGIWALVVLNKPEVKSAFTA